MACDKDTPIAVLRERIAAFAQERDWDQFHSPKNLAMAMAVEVGELLELFQWKTEEQSRAVVQNPEEANAIREELADVAIIVLNLCNRLDVDLTRAVLEKLALNASRYPVELSRGNAAKYTTLSRPKAGDGTIHCTD